MDYFSIAQMLSRTGKLISFSTFRSDAEVRNRFRSYEIISMDIETYNLSRTFLFRYHTLRKMRDILKDVPASTCTPSWFINQYLLNSAYPSHYRWQRINSLDNIGSSDEDTSMASGHTSDAHPPSDALTHRPRHLRIVHKNEVWSIFASHSKWIVSLIEKHKDLKDKVNTQSWNHFLSQISQLRQMAELDEDTCGKWGLIDEQGGNKIGKIPTSDILPSLSMPEVVIPQSTSSKSQKHKKSTSTKVGF